MTITGPGSLASREPVGLRVRLALVFVTVAVLAVGLVAALAVTFTERDIATLLQLRRDDLVSSLATDAVSTYGTGKPGWSDADLKPALQLAGTDGAQAAVLDARGQVVASTLAVPLLSGLLTRRPLVLDGRRIGTLLVRYTGRGLTESADNLRTSLVRAVIGAAVLAAVLALVASVLVSRRITRPVIAVIESVRAMGRGERNARVGAVTGAPAELRDLAVTFDQMADTLAGQERLRRDLVADVAHELRTPVAVLQANTEALLDDLMPHGREQTVSLHEEVLRLSRLVGDLQTLAAAEAAALQLSLRPCDLASIAAAAAEDWTASFAAAGIGFSHEVTAAPVLADADRVHQIIDNLLSNALKFTPRGGQVTMRLSAADGQARLEVSDTGPGIEPADQPRVFDRLWRGGSAGQTTGSGIGLAICAELARAHRGSVRVTSEPGHGSRFSLILPLHETAQP